MSKAKEVQLFIDKESNWTELVRVIDGKIRIGCCDCGLTHDFEFEIKDNKFVLFRAKRNNHSTAQKRKAMNVKVNVEYKK